MALPFLNLLTIRLYPIYHYTQLLTCGTNGRNYGDVYTGNLQEKNPSGLILMIFTHKNERFLNKQNTS